MGGGISDLVKQINSIDIEKTDKFIELSKALESLSDKMGEIDNGIFKMLELLAARLEQTSKVIENSDNIQEKRIKNIKEQAKEISKLIDKPMTVEFKPEEKIEYGSLLKSSIFGKDKEENTKNKNIPAPHLNNNTSNNQSSSAELVSIAGTTAEIQALLYQILQQRG
jgi:phosphoenolpyruvate synthase/pyruvate phosphate dikinase